MKMKTTMLWVVSVVIIALQMLTLAGCSASANIDGDDIAPATDNQSDDSALIQNDVAPEYDNPEPLPDKLTLTVNTIDDTAITPLGEGATGYYDGHNSYYSEETAQKTIRIGDGYAVSKAAYEGIPDDQLVFAVLSDKEILTAEFGTRAKQIYRVSIEDMSAEAILPQEEYGFTYDDYYAITGKWETISWFDYPIVNKNGSHFAYWSNKFVADGKPAYEAGIWVYDLQTGSQTRVASPNDRDISVSDIEWIDDTHVMFEAGDIHYSYDIITETTSEIITRPGPEVYVIAKDNVMVYHGNDGITLLNAKTGREYIIKTDGRENFDKVYVCGDIAAIETISTNRIYIVDMAKGSAYLVDSPFGEAHPQIIGWTTDGRLVIKESYNPEAPKEEQLYSVDIVR